MNNPIKLDTEKVAELFCDPQIRANINSIGDKISLTPKGFLTLARTINVPWQRLYSYPFDSITGLCGFWEEVDLILCYEEAGLVPLWKETLGPSYVTRNFLSLPWEVQLPALELMIKRILEETTTGVLWELAPHYPSIEDLASHRREMLRVLGQDGLDRKDLGLGQRTIDQEPTPKDHPPMHDNSAYLTTDEGEITILANGTLTSVPPDHPHHSTILRHLENRDFDSALRVADMRQAAFQLLIQVPGLTLETKGSDIHINDRPIRTGEAELIRHFLGSDMPREPLLKFLSRAFSAEGQHPEGPDIQAQLLSFLTLNGFYIDEDGMIIAWKKVTDGLRDPWTGLLDYSPPCRVTMPREVVDSNPMNACAPGLHFATWKYTYRYQAGSRVVEMRIDPAHVMAVPVGEPEKARAHTLSVVREVEDWQGFSQDDPPIPANAILPAAFADLRSVREEFTDT